MDELVPVTLVTTPRESDPSVAANIVREVIDGLVGEEDRTLCLEELDGDELTLTAVIDACQTPPFLSSRRVIVARDAGRWSSEELEPLFEYLADPLPTSALVLVGGGGRISQKLVNAAKKVGRVVDAAAPTGKARTAWLADKLRRAPLKLDADAARLIGDHLGEDLGRLPSLIEVLVAAYGEGASLGGDDIGPFLGEAGGLAPWDLTDAIDRGDTAGALTVLHRLMGGGDRHPLAVLGTLHRHFAAVLRLEGSGVGSEADAAAATGMGPYPAGKALRAAQRLGAAGTRRAITLIADADLDLKGARDLPEELVMEVLVARLSRLGPRRAPSARRSAAGSSTGRR